MQRKIYYQHFNSLMQKRHNSIANAIELCLSCIKPSIYAVMVHRYLWWPVITSWLHCGVTVLSSYVVVQCMGECLWSMSAAPWPTLLIAGREAQGPFSLALSKLRLCSANNRAGYFSNLACDWLSLVWAYSEKDNRPWSMESGMAFHIVQIEYHNSKME